MEDQILWTVSYSTGTTHSASNPQPTRPADPRDEQDAAPSTSSTGDSRQHSRNVGDILLEALVRLFSKDGFVFPASARASPSSPPSASRAHDKGKSTLASAPVPLWESGIGSNSTAPPAALPLKFQDHRIELLRLFNCLLSDVLYRRNYKPSG